MSPIWIITEHGFYSAVQYDPAKAAHSGLPAHEHPEDWLVVRCRARADAEYLVAYVDASGGDGAQAEVIETPHGDYPFRVIVRRSVFQAFGTAEVEAIDYGNFKDRVAQTQGWQRHDTCLRVWGALRDLSREP